MPYVTGIFGRNGDKYVLTDADTVELTHDGETRTWSVQELSAQPATFEPLPGYSAAWLIAEIEEYRVFRQGLAAQ